MKFGANGNGEYFTDDQNVGEFSIVLRGNTMAAALAGCAWQNGCLALKDTMVSDRPFCVICIENPPESADFRGLWSR